MGRIVRLWKGTRPVPRKGRSLRKWLRREAVYLGLISPPILLSYVPFYYFVIRFSEAQWIAWLWVSMPYALLMNLWIAPWTKFMWSWNWRREHASAPVPERFPNEELKPSHLSDS